MSKTTQLKEILTELHACRKCGLCAGRIQPVLGAGVPNSRIVIIGEAPGKNEDEQGKPFVGRSGQLLDAMLAEVGLYRDKNVFITNIVKCRPPENRDPAPDEVAACRPYLDRILDIIDPKVILCVGRISAQRLIDPNFRVTREHGQIHQLGGRIVMGTFHPAAVLRNPANRPLMEADLQRLVALIREEDVGIL